MSAKNKFTIFGIAFGFLFPIFSTLLESWFQFGNISFSSILQIQTSSPLLWVIDTAPIFLGLFARIAEINQLKVEHTIKELKQTNHQLKIEIEKRNNIEKKLYEMVDVYWEDLHSAKIIQEFSLPEIPNLIHCNLYYKYLPLNQVGGDVITLAKLHDEDLSIFVGDVVGHGISAALITSLVNVLTNRSRNIHGKSPKKYLEYFNHEIFHYLPENYYLTALYGFIKFHDNSANFTFSRAGHPYPFIYSDKEKKTKFYELIGTPIGFIDKLTYNELSIKLFPKDKIFIITDGIVEVKNKQNKLLGYNAFSSIITEACENNLSIQEIIEYILKEIEKYSEGVPLEDDRIILGIEIV